MVEYDGGGVDDGGEWVALQVLVIEV